MLKSKLLILQDNELDNLEARRTHLAPYWHRWWGQRERPQYQRQALLTQVSYICFLSLCYSSQDPTGLQFTRNAPLSPKILNQSALNLYFGEDYGKGTEYQGSQCNLYILENDTEVKALTIVLSRIEHHARMAVLDGGSRYLKCDMCFKGF